MLEVREDPQGSTYVPDLLTVKVRPLGDGMVEGDRSILGLGRYREPAKVSCFIHSFVTQSWMKNNMTGKALLPLV